jgi:hypothetical protein
MGYTCQNMALMFYSIQERHRKFLSLFDQGCFCLLLGKDISRIPFLILNENTYFKKCPVIF